MCTIKAIDAERKCFTCPTCRAEVAHLQWAEKPLKRMPTFEADLPTGAAARGTSLLTVFDFLQARAAAGTGELAATARTAIDTWEGGRRIPGGGVRIIPELRSITHESMEVVWPSHGRLARSWIVKLVEREHAGRGARATPSEDEWEVVYEGPREAGAGVLIDNLLPGCEYHVRVAYIDLQSGATSDFGTALVVTTRPAMPPRDWARLRLAFLAQDTRQTGQIPSHMLQPCLRAAGFPATPAEVREAHVMFGTRGDGGARPRFDWVRFCEHVKEPRGQQDFLERLERAEQRDAEAQRFSSFGAPWINYSLYGQV